MKYLLLLLPLTALALEPGTPAMGPNGTPYPNGLPEKVPWNTNVSGPYWRATEIHERDGVRPLSDFRKVTNTTETVETIDPLVRADATVYKNALESLFEAGAHTNQAMVWEAVYPSVATNTAIPDATKLMILTARKTLIEFNVRHGLQDKAWAFPFGQSSITNTATTITWEPVE